MHTRLLQIFFRHGCWAHHNQPNLPFGWKFFFPHGLSLLLHNFPLVLLEFAFRLLWNIAHQLNAFGSQQDALPCLLVRDDVRLFQVMLMTGARVILLTGLHSRLDLWIEYTRQ